MLRLVMPSPTLLRLVMVLLALGLPATPWAQGWGNLGQTAAPEAAGWARWWTEPLGTWMAWTRATAAFFIFIFASIAAMGVWEYFSPGGDPRRGILGLETTRGDRLFLSLLGSAYIYLAWIGLFGPPIWWPTLFALAWTVFVFRKV